jgi:signal transduction histidine kinase
VRIAVKNLGGDIRVTRARGQGTRFDFRIPIASYAPVNVLRRSIPVAAVH